MHRSKTSLLASMLNRAGLHLGDRLLAPGPHNRRGYFEDLDFVEFHEKLLADLGTSLYLPRAPRGGIAARHRARAEALVTARAAQPAWGWKDPRTTLFLDLWAAVAPDALFVFVCRRPAEVIDSLRRRGDAELQRRYPGAATLARLGVPRFRAREALRLWRRYNERLAAFAERHRPRCHVVRAEALPEQVPALVEALRRAGWPLPACGAAADVIDPSLVAGPPPASLERLCRGDRRTVALVARLDALAGP